MDLKGIAAIVTGGASGLGAATARELTTAGAKCFLFDLNQAVAEKTAAEIGARAIACNVAEAASAEQAVAGVVAENEIRVLVNCAGIGTPAKAVGRDGPLPLETFAKVINVNLIGTFNVTRLVAAAMQKLKPLADNERGVIINTASVAAYDGQIGQPAYAASKAGIVGLTLPLAREFANFGIRVCTIAPGIFSTPMLHNLPEEAKQSLAAAVPFPRRLGEPSEYARLARHICENGMLNGETIRLDGAIRMAPK